MKASCCIALFTLINTFLSFSQNVSLNLDGANDYLSINQAISNTYTKEAWVQFESLSAPNNNVISGSTNAFWVNNSLLRAGHNGQWAQVSDTELMELNKWYHIAVSFNASTNDMYLYKNGVLIDSNLNVPLPNASTNVLLGSHQGNNVMDGELDEVRIWNDVRTQQEIRDNMFASLTGSEANLVHYFDFEEGIAGGDNTARSAATDLTGNANASFVNFALTGTVSNYIAGGDFRNIWDGTTWSSGGPATTDQVAILSNTAPSSFTAVEVMIGRGYELSTSGITVTITNELINNGNGLSGAGTISFDNNGGNVNVIGNTISFEGVMEVTSGTSFLTNDKLTLTASSPTAYGMLTGTGTVTGNVTVEQWVDLPAQDGNGHDGRWLDIAANVTGADIGDWNEGETMVAANSGQGTIWYWDADNAQYVAPSALTDDAVLGRGYSVFAGTNAFATFLVDQDEKIDLSGAPNMTDVDVTLGYNAGSGSNTEGWNQLGNPFAAQYDWDNQDLSGLNLQSNAIYILKSDGSTYATYTKGGSGTNGGTRYIAPGQAFWIQAAAASPGTITLAESNRGTGNGTTLFKTNPDQIKLGVKEVGQNTLDELIVGFESQATMNLDRQYDAPKKFNGGGNPNFFSMLNGVDYAINKLSANGTNDSIPLALQYAPQGVKMEIIANTQDLQAYTYVELRDAKTGQAIDLKAQPTYQFANDTNMVEGRFSLHFNNHNVSLKENQATEDNWFAYQGATGLMVSFDEKLMGETLVIHNISGIQVAEMEISQSDMAILQSQSRGVYFLRLRGHESKVKKVIQQ